jgi:hypothetical protein
MMDTEGSDSGTLETLNGEMKPDAAKLAHSAIIKQVRKFVEEKIHFS